MFAGFCLKNVFLKLINIFAFFVFILVDGLSGSIKTKKSQKNVFTFAENNFGERRVSCTCLIFGEILLAGTKRAVPGGQYRSLKILHAHKIQLIVTGFCKGGS